MSPEEKKLDATISETQTLLTRECEEWDRYVTGEFPAVALKPQSRGIGAWLREWLLGKGHEDG